MATVYPFRALRYDPARVAIEDVVTQPYDKITPAMQERYYELSPFNLVRIILGKREPADGARDNVYARAAQSLRDWRRSGVLTPDAVPSIYLYTQRFTVPGEPGPEYERRGFIALGNIHDYNEGVVFRHEQTLAKPKADRLELLRATRAHFGQIFMLYRDPGGEIDALLALTRAPEIDIRDEYGVQHQLWQVTNSAVLETLSGLMQPKKLIIADGHHRYETALTYRNERRTQAAAEEDAPYERVMMTFVNIDGQGLVILPTHRVVHGLAGFDLIRFIEAAREYFTVNPLKERVTRDSATRWLREKRAENTAFVMVTANADFVLEAKPGAIDGLLSELSPRQRELDVMRLHKVLLERVLRLSEESIRKQENISYVRDASEAIARVRGGAQAAFLMNPVRMEQVRDLAFAGEVLPQKSTDFYPKLLSGLTIYAFD
jgi:uncharacterized protein (DUF1015 family)